MLYAIIAQDIENSLTKRMGARPDHVTRLNQLKDEGRLIEAGFSGSLIVADFEDLQQAREWADADPYVAAGVYASVVVKPFNKVLP